MTDVKIEKGIALVLVGPRGHGKEQQVREFARDLARKDGAFCEIEMRHLQQEFLHWASARIKTIIVRGFPSDMLTLARVKQYVTADQIEMQRKGHPIELVPAPNFIFCVGRTEPLMHLDDERRFRIVQVGDAS